MVKTSFGVSYYGCHFPWHVQQDFKELKRAGVGHVVYAAAEYELGFYLESTYAIAAEARKQGIEFFIDFWAHGNAFGGEGGSFFIFEHPETWQVTNTGRRIPVACFNHPTFLSFMRAQVKKVAGHCDGIFLDEPAFYSHIPTKEYGCFCDECEAKFRKQYHHPLAKASAAELMEFRNDELVRFIKNLSSYYKRLAGGKVMICLYPHERDSTLSWERFLTIKSIDIFGSDPYWQDPFWQHIRKTPSFVSEVGVEVVAAARAHRKESQIWIQNFSIKNAAEVGDAVKHAKACVPGYITAWTYKGACYSQLSNKDWRSSWAHLLREYGTKSAKGRARR